MISGKAVILGDNINTDFIISGRYKFSITDISELARHIMEDIDPDFPNKVIPGNTILVAGGNFGLGSSREQAPLVIKAAGINAVAAKSFARIFYRNAFNIGLTLIETDTSCIKEGDELSIDLDTRTLRNITASCNLTINPINEVMKQLLQDGGLVAHFKKHGKINL